MELLEEHHSFGGQQQRWQHYSTMLGCVMKFSVFIPPSATKKPSPVLYWLSGLTCNDENFATKAGAQRTAAKLGIILVMPDTSPRGEDVPDDESYDLGQGAGFYLNATQPPWDKHFHMYDYISDELPTLIARHFSISERTAIAGHSMGGHGALTIALKNPDRYCSVSAFAPIVNPTCVSWGKKAFSHYLGNNKAQWHDWDSCSLLAHATHRNPCPILIDQGDADLFLHEQLQPAKFGEIARQKAWPLTLRVQPGYDHSYYFIASFIEEHLHFHARYLFS